MTIQLQGEQEFSQEVAVSEVVPKDVLLERRTNWHTFVRYLSKTSEKGDVGENE